MLSEPNVCCLPGFDMEHIFSILCGFEMQPASIIPLKVSRSCNLISSHLLWKCQINTINIWGLEWIERFLCPFQSLWSNYFSYQSLGVLTYQKSVRVSHMNHVAPSFPVSLGFRSPCEMFFIDCLIADLYSENSSVRQPFTHFSGHIKQFELNIPWVHCQYFFS